MSPRFPLVAVLAAMAAVTGLDAQNKSAPPRHTAAQLAAADADATTSAQLQARRYQIWAARLDSGLTDADRAELENIGRAVRAIEAKYETPGLLELSVDLRNRARERLVALAGPTWNPLLLARFPMPEQVRRDFADPLHAAAALEVLYYEFALSRTLRPPRTPEMDARDAAYRSAVAAIVAAQAPDGEASPAARAFAEGALRLSGSPAFKREVLGRYLPLFASWVRDDPAPAARLIPQHSAIDALIFRPIGTIAGEPLLLGHAAIPAAALLALIGGIFIPLRRARSAGRRHNADRPPGSGTAAHPLDLPIDLQVLDLPGRMHPELTATSGIVMEKEGWTEYSTTTTTTPPTPQQPGHTSTRTTSTRKDRLWVRTTKGEEQSWTVTGDVFPARAGHPVTWVAARLRQDPQTICMVFNHATGHHYERPWVDLAHRGTLGTFLLTLIWLLLCGAAMAWLEWRLFQSGVLIHTLSITAALVLAAWVLIARALVRAPRRRAWEKHFRPRLLEWLRLVGPAIPAAVAGTPPPITRAR